MGKSLIRRPRQLWLAEVMSTTYSGGLVDGIYVSKVRGSAMMSTFLARTFGKMTSLRAVGTAGRSRWLR